jgi:hypothetical protein
VQSGKTLNIHHSNRYVYLVVIQLGGLSVGAPLDGRGHRHLHRYHQGEGSGLQRATHGIDYCSKNQGGREEDTGTDVVASPCEVKTSAEASPLHPIYGIPIVRESGR